MELRQLFHFGPNAVGVAMRAEKNPIGLLTKDEARKLAIAVRKAATISEELQNVVWHNLTSSIY
ncbi:MAG TPA: hypothetical protein VGG99_10880 [Acetobacteraceae bacterium]